MYEFKILNEISKGTFEISHKILNTYTAKDTFYRLAFLCVITIPFNYDVININETVPMCTASDRHTEQLNMYTESVQISTGVLFPKVD